MNPMLLHISHVSYLLTDSTLKRGDSCFLGVVAQAWPEDQLDSFMTSICLPRRVAARHDRLCLLLSQPSGRKVFRSYSAKCTGLFARDKFGSGLE